MNIKEKQNIALSYKKDKNSTRDELIAILKEYIEKPVSNDEDFRIFCAYVSSGARKWHDDSIGSLLSELDNAIEEKTGHKEINIMYSPQDIFSKFHAGHFTYGVAFVSEIIEIISNRHDFKLALKVLIEYNNNRKSDKMKDCELHFLLKMQDIICREIKPIRKGFLRDYHSDNSEWKNFKHNDFVDYIGIAKEIGYQVKEEL